MRQKFWSLLILSAFSAALLLPSTVLATPITGADTDVTKFFVDTSEYTTEANNATAGDVFWPFTGGSDLYFGSTGKFSRIYFYVSSEMQNSSWTIAESGATAFKYHNGSDWTDLAVTNVTGAFNATGIHYFTFTPPTDWAQNEVNSSTNYYLKVMCDTGCNRMEGNIDMDQISLLAYAAATPEFSTYVLMLTMSLAGYMVFKHTQSTAFTRA